MIVKRLALPLALSIVAAALAACASSDPEDGTGAGESNLTESTGASCSLICGGQVVSCSEGGTAETCDISRFSVRPRCPSEVKFETKSCNAGSSSSSSGGSSSGGSSSGGSSSGGSSSGASSAKGSCSIICGGTAASCVNDVAEGSCDASAFGAIPRCPHSFEFKAGATCSQ